MTKRYSFLSMIGAAFVALGAVLSFAGNSTAHVGGRASDDSVAFDPALVQALRYRHVGPFRGGRSTAVAGVPDEIFTYYMGSTGGGVWKTTDAGQSWKSVSDGYFEAGSIGAIAVAESNSDIVYVGTGSACPRANISPGIGMYKSTDAGQSWSHIGLRDSGQIGKLAVHPDDPSLVYVAALGHIFGPNEQRGVFRSKDGGESWEKVLYLSDQTGAVDIKMDVNDPNVLYAAFWRAERKPWTLISGGPEGGVYKTTDGGDTWTKLTRGLPVGLTGRIGVAVSPADSGRVWAIIEGERSDSGFERDETGLYRSDDAGATWALINDHPDLHQRPWYYHHLVADPKDADTLYHVGDSFWKSTDGGESFTTIAVTHSDNHDLWINPHNPQLMIEANDGGASVSVNGGETWSSLLNQPTAELYRVEVDEQFLYRLYAGQQDYSTISVPSSVPTSGGITLQHWSAVGGGEMGPVAVDPRNPEIIYAGGNISRVDRRIDRIRRIMPYPQYWSGVAPEKVKYRFQSHSPIILSPHNPDVVYTTSQFVHRSDDGGQSWEVVGRDLSRDDPAKRIPSGGPLTRDNTSVEYYGTISELRESALTPGLLWAGSNDGLVHLSRDNGASWHQVTPPQMPEWGTVSTIDPSTHDPARAVMSVHRYLMDDFHPYIFRTDDYGASWELISEGNGIPDDHFVRVAREDPDRPGLLYAGTEFGLYVSFDDGALWQSLQLNLPATPISDLKIHRQDLVVSTQGRGFWILDDVTPLHQLSDLVAAADVHLFKPRDIHRVEGGRGATSWSRYVTSDRLRGAQIETHRVGENPPAGLMIFYTLQAGAPGALRLEILDAADRTVRTFSSSSSEDALPTASGMNRFVWDLRYPGAEIIVPSRLDGTTAGPRAVPGRYQVRLTVDGQSMSEDFQVLMDPRSPSSFEDLQEQFDFLLRARDRVTETHAAVRKIHQLRQGIDETRQQTASAAPAAAGAAEQQADALRSQIVEAAASIAARLDDLEDKLRQKRAKAYQDTANFEPLIDDQFAWLGSHVSSADTRPTDAAHQRFRDLETQLAGHLAELAEILEIDVPLLERLLREWENR